MQEIGEFVDKSDLAGVRAVLRDIANWRPIGRDDTRQQTEAATWQEILSTRPDRVEDARLFVRRTLDANQGNLSDGFWQVEGLNDGR